MMPLVKRYALLAAGTVLDIATAREVIRHGGSLIVSPIVSPEVIELAIQSVREHYTPQGCDRRASEDEQQKHPGQFTYSKGGSGGTIAMAAAGVVCMQEFGQYGDWRIPKNMEIISAAIDQLRSPRPGSGEMPFAVASRHIHAIPIPSAMTRSVTASTPHGPSSERKVMRPARSLTQMA